MTTEQASGRREVADQLGRICGICAIGFIALLAVLAMLDKMAVAKEISGGLLLFAPLASYAAIGLYRALRACSSSACSAARFRRLSPAWRGAPNGCRPPSS